MNTGETIVKIGITCRSAKIRLMDIATSFMNKFGYLPMVEILLEEKVRNYYGVESLMLAKSKHIAIDWVMPFDGSTETRRIYDEFDEDWFLSEYKQTIAEIGNNEPEIKGGGYVEDNTDEILNEMNELDGGDITELIPMSMVDMEM